ncbi:MAG: DUF3108 domain-containing protein [Pseudidiomarina maritima]|nr:DUF3108 domain-containing protein [Pseudidiomarina maritima]
MGNTTMAILRKLGLPIHSSTLSYLSAVTGIALLLSLSMSEAVAAEPDLLQPYEARYEVHRGGSQYGEAVRELSYDANKNTYSLYTETEISLLFLSDRRRFWSEFVLHEGKVQSQSMEYKRTGTGRDKGFAGTFDWSQQQIIDQATQQPLSLPWLAQRIDEASHIEQLRLDVAEADNGAELTYQVLDEKGQADELIYAVQARETLRLPYGDIEAIKVVRVRENSRRETDYWLAPELDYMLVKMTQRKDGDEVASLLLRQLLRQ